MGGAQQLSLGLLVIQDAAIEARKPNAWERPKEAHFALTYHGAKGTGEALNAVLNPK
jgi:hypothetical protein